MERSRNIYLNITNSISHKEELLKCYDSICSTMNGDGCGRKMKGRYLTVDHIIPRALGGTGDIINKQLLCWPCHSKKNTRHNKELGLSKRPPKSINIQLSQ